MIETIEDYNRARALLIGNRISRHQDSGGNPPLTCLP
jgi:hypothetical protein